MSPEPFFIFDGKPGDLVAIHYADSMHTDLGVLLERYDYGWSVLTRGIILRLRQDSLEVVMETVKKSS